MGLLEDIIALAARVTALETSVTGHTTLLGSHTASITALNTTSQQQAASLVATRERLGRMALFDLGFLPYAGGNGTPAPGEFAITWIKIDPTGNMVFKGTQGGLEKYIYSPWFNFQATWNPTPAEWSAMASQFT